MRVVLSAEDWKRRKLFVATPMFGGFCTGQFTQSMIVLQRLCDGLGVELSFNAVVNESLITRARNTLVQMFLDSSSTHLMFIDADIGFDAGDVVRLLGSIGDDGGYDVLAGSYPVKTIDWDRVRTAALSGDDDIARAGNVFVSRPTREPDADLNGDVVPVDYAGTGFMMIRRSLFRRLRERHPEAFYVADFSSVGLGGDRSRKIHLYFHAGIDEATKHYLPEDYWFCQSVREVGGTVGVCPGMELSHTGSYTFSGSLSSASR